jgi:hypothetical protein
MTHPTRHRSPASLAHHTLALVLALLAANACTEPTLPPASPARDRSSSRADAPDAAIQVAHTVVPLETSEVGEVDWVPPANPANPATLATALHYVWLPARHVEHARLFVFLPGTGNRPGDYQLFSAEAARAGYHVIGLMYQNDKALENICKASPDLDCAEKVRMESLTGASLSGLVTVTEGNSIDHRLTRLIVYLKTRYPNEHWHKFLKRGKPDWSRIAVSGQSQGAGQAALIARERLVPRVVMLSGPPDQSNAPRIDSWVRIGATPPSSMFALYHFADRLKPGISANMGALGFRLDTLGSMGVGTLGPWCTAANVRPLADWAFGSAHVLVTNLFPRGAGGCAGANSGNPHRSTGRDEYTPLLADGTPALLGAWRYLIGDPASDGDEIADDDEIDER